MKEEGIRRGDDVKVVFNFFFCVRDRNISSSGVNKKMKILLYRYKSPQHRQVMKFCVDDLLNHLRAIIMNIPNALSCIH